MSYFYTFVTFAKSEAFRADINSHSYFASQNQTTSWCEKTYDLVGGKFGFQAIPEIRLNMAGINAQQRAQLITQFDVTIEVADIVQEEEVIL